MSTIFHIRRSHGALVKALRVSSLVAVRPEHRDAGVGSDGHPRPWSSTKSCLHDLGTAQRQGPRPIRWDRPDCFDTRSLACDPVSASPGPVCWCRARVPRLDPPEWTQRRTKHCGANPAPLERIDRNCAARRIDRGQIAAGRQTHPNRSSAVLKRLCRETRAAELPSRTCLEPDVPRDLAGAPIESIETRTTGDPKSAVSRGQRRDDPLLADRGSVAAAGNTSFST